jgi:hypothetical protein
LLATEKQWAYPLSRSTALIWVATVSLVLSTLAIVASSLKINIASLRNQAPTILLVIISLLMLRLGLNRVALINSYYAIWVPLLLVSCRSHGLDASRVRFRFWISVVILGTVLLGLFSSIASRSYPLSVFAVVPVYFFLVYRSSSPSPRFLSAFVTILLIPQIVLNTFDAGNLASVNALSHFSRQPSSSSSQSAPLIGADELEVAEFLKSNSVSSCIFDFTNSGLIHYASGKGMCSQVTYPVYGSVNYEQQMISELAKNSPSHVVSSTNKWWFSIDGRSMVDRFPLLAQEIMLRYPVEKCFSEYCVRSRLPPLR